MNTNAFNVGGDSITEKSTIWLEPITVLVANVEQRARAVHQRRDRAEVGSKRSRVEQAGWISAVHLPAAAAGAL
jgi:hypothetical protein